MRFCDSPLKRDIMIIKLISNPLCLQILHRGLRVGRPKERNCRIRAPHQLTCAEPEQAHCSDLDLWRESGAGGVNIRSQVTQRGGIKGTGLLETHLQVHLFNNLLRG